ncbi:hypothetical protein B0B52_06840 [Polaromonas sp. A23]|nr:hypothetical protein B0B52_06840 [Polaromonas sp. A23]
MVSVRLSPLFILAPVFGSMQVPAHLRVFLILALSLLMALALQLQPVSFPLTPGALIIAMAGELLVGAALAAGVMIPFAAFSFGGRLLDLQIGFGVASLLDQATRAATPLIGTALQMMAVAMFYLLDAHHVLIRGVAFSFERIPLASGIAHLDIGFLVAYGGTLFSLGFILIAPVVAVLFFVDVGMAVMSRTMPQMNIFALGISVKVLVGMILLAMSIRYMGGVAMKIFMATFQFFDRVLQ